MDAISKVLESPAHSLFRRCLDCGNNSPQCPTCPAGQSCWLISQTCNQCAHMICVDSADGGSSTSTSNSNSSSGSSANAGAIAGAVIGGLIVIAIATFLVWKYCVKPRRAAAEAPWQDYNMGSEKDVSAVTPRPRDTLASRSSRASAASSVLTRASNIIQIAYIPGVTNRSAQSSQDLVPPVPPIPAASNGSSPYTDNDEHFFRPELRASTYSAVTDRNSIASTVYRSNAIVSPVPAQMISRVKPTAVSVRSSNKNSPTISRSTTPPMPHMPSVHSLNTKSSIVGRVGQPKPVHILRKQAQPPLSRPHVYELDGSGSEPSTSRKNSVASHLYAATSPSEDASDIDDDIAAGRGLIPVTNPNRKSSSVLPAELSGHSRHVPLSQNDIEEDEEEVETGRWDGQRTKRAQSINQIIEDAAKLASKDYTPHEPSPFDDVHVARTP